MTQKDLILKYIDEFGSILPAKIGGSAYGGGFFGSESSKRCRELRAKGKLISKQEGKFERFFRPARIILPPAFKKEIKVEQTLFS